MNRPVINVNVNKYLPDKILVFQNQTVRYKLYTIDEDWQASQISFKVRWDQDFDASNGVQWSDWEENTDPGHYALRDKAYSTVGKYTLTFEIELSDILGHSDRATKQVEIIVSPLPTKVYQDQSLPYPNVLFYLEGYDNIYNRPLLILPGFNPSQPPTYSPTVSDVSQYNFLDEVRNQGYDVFIMIWGNGAQAIEDNKQLIWNGTDNFEGSAYNVDPSAQFDADGNAYLCYYHFNIVNDIATDRKIFFTKSTNSGQTWSGHSNISFTDSKVDKPYMTVDVNQNSSYKNNIYVAWTAIEYNAGEQDS